MKRILLIPVILVVILLSACAATNAGSSTSDSYSIRTSIQNFNDSQVSTDPNEYFNVKVEPIKVTYGTVYDICLMSQDDYFYSVAFVTWSASDFAAPSSTERNVGAISNAETKSLRDVTLSAPMMDKDINPIRVAHNALYTKRYNEALAHGDVHVDAGLSVNANGASLSPHTVLQGGYALTPTDYQSLCRGYVKIVVVNSSAAFDKLTGSSTP